MTNLIVGLHLLFLLVLDLVYNTTMYGFTGTRSCWYLPDVDIQGGFKISGNANKYIYGDTKDVNNNSAFWLQGAGTAATTR